MKIYIHLGIQKTGSTFLQKEFFSLYKDKTVYINRSSLAEFKTYILRTDDFAFQATKAREIFNSIVEKHKVCDRVVLSDEEFYGNPFMGVLDRKRNIDRLVEVFGDALHVIIFIRNQQPLIDSLYKQYIKTGGTASFKNFISSNGYPLIFNIDHLKYDKYLNYVRLKIGQRKLKILLFEEFVNDMQSTLQELDSFVNESVTKFDFSPINCKIVNPSLKGGNVPIMRFFNKFTKSPKEPFLFLGIIFHKILRQFLLKSKFEFFKKRSFFITNEQSIDEIKVSNHNLMKQFSTLKFRENNYLIQKFQKR
ncbi:hypothetical protein [uncultured Winogradskyella sp.]|uniref:hypothetical protein n=1 Tax=uncultured Winogradskyella sp. TaxID=395353 RepID=UPI00262978C1|nr:hypothetical protein [uncultured Winogradskyella sp.]